MTMNEGYKFYEWSQFIVAVWRPVTQPPLFPAKIVTSSRLEDMNEVSRQCEFTPRERVVITACTCIARVHLPIICGQMQGRRGRRLARENARKWNSKYLPLFYIPVYPCFFLSSLCLFLCRANNTEENWLSARRESCAKFAHLTRMILPISITLVDTTMKITIKNSHCNIFEKWTREKSSIYSYRR